MSYEVSEPILNSPFEKPSRYWYIQEGEEPSCTPGGGRPSFFRPATKKKETLMKYERFEQLPVWQAAIKLGREVYALTEGPAFRRQHRLRDQIERAAVSVSNNVAEGFERGTTQELLTFLYIARGSAGEVRSMLCLLEAIPAFADLKSQISDLKSEAEQIARQLRAWADSLQNSSITGQRYLNAKTRKAEQTRRDREDFLKQLEEVRRGKSPNSKLQ